jgi:acyl-CoA thioesterase
MYANDAAAKSLGMTIDEVGPGYAKLSMQVAASMVNGHDVAHGGFIFLLADSAFAYACNSRGERNVALSASISFAAPGRTGETLTAVARERTRAGTTGVYDVEVMGPDGTTLALFRGTSYKIKGSLLDS